MGTFDIGDIVRVTGGNHAGSLAVIIAPDGFPLWEKIKGTSEALGMYCLSFGVMSGVMAPTGHLELHRSAAQVAAREVPGAVGYSVAVYRADWDGPRLDSDDGGRYTLAEALVLVDSYRRSDRRWPDDEIKLAAIIVIEGLDAPEPIELPRRTPGAILLDDARPFEPGNPVFVDEGREGRVTSVDAEFVWVSIKDPMVNTGWRPANGYYPADVEHAPTEAELDERIPYLPVSPVITPLRFSDPAPAATSMTVDAQEALNEAAFAWVDTDPDHDPTGVATGDLVAAIVRYRAVTR